MDELTLRYREACDQDDRRPSDSVREAVHAHARMMIAARQPNGGERPEGRDEARPAANQSRWKMSLLASVALAGLTSLLVLQFDRGTPEEKELGLGQASQPARPPVSPTVSSLPAAATATATPPVTPTTQPKAPKVALVPATAATTAPAAPQAIEATPSPTLADASPAARAQESADTNTSKNAPAPFAQNTVPNTAQAPAPAQAPATAPAPAPAAKQELARAAAGQAQRARLNADVAQPAPTSLHDMARMGQVAVLDRLLAEGAAVNAPDATGKTPLMLAVINGHVATVRRLLAAGSNPALTDREGLTALQHARRLGRDDIARLLEEHP